MGNDRAYGNVTKTKVCVKCGEEKDICYFDFRIDTHKYRGVCKTCHKGVKEPLLAKQKRIFELYDKGFKECGRCHKILSIENFGIDNITATRLTSQCKECIRKKGIKLRSTKKYRMTLYKYRYNATEADYIDYELKNKCEICGKEIEGSDKCFDHCHTTEKYRGVLCYECNLGLGHFCDDTIRLENAINYLKSFESKSGIDTE